MSLKIWLPLNNNINNQGLTDWTPTIQSGTTAAYVNGKIGKALHTGGIVMPASVTKEVLNNNEFSYACWLYVGGESGSTQSAMIFGNNSGRQFSMFQYPTANDFHYSWANYENGTWSSYWGGVLSGVLPSNQWTHIAVVYNNNITDKLKIYINGVSQTLASRSFVSKSTSFEFDTQLIHNSTYHYLNDVRLYDHALSAKEVSELAKGLVLHYRLADPYIESSKNLCTVTRSGEATDSTWGGHVTQWKFYDSTNDPVPFKEGLKAEIVYGQNGSTGGGASKYICVVTVSPSTTYTYSCYIKASDDFEYTHQNFLYIYENTASGSGVTQFGCFNKERMERIGNGWYRIWGSFTTQSTTERVSLYNYTYPSKTVNYWFGGWQIEQKDHVTPFIKPNGERDENVVWDCSGFQRNGTKYGSLSFSDDTARYRWSYYFEDYTRRIECFIDNNWIPDAITMSCWIKSTTRSARGGYHEPLNMHSTNYEISIYGSSGQARLGLVVGGTRYVSNVGPDLLDGKWHMLAITYNGSKICRYVDGELIHSEDRTGALTAVGTLGIGTLAGNTTYGSTQLYESDVRIYSTALSADDTLALYNLGGSLDSNGTFHTYEYVEV